MEKSVLESVGQGSYLFVTIDENGSATVEVRLHKQEPPELIGTLLANLHLQAALLFRDKGQDFGDAITRISRMQTQVLSALVQGYLDDPFEGIDRTTVN